MHTPEQARTLWCPMSRVAQVGHTDTQASYNRTLTKDHVAVRVAAIQNPDEFDLGDTPQPDQRVEMLLRTHPAKSMAANCCANECAMWRWENSRTINGQLIGYCGLAGAPAAI